jgi:hypothetical protein
MGQPREPAPCKLFMSIIFSDDSILRQGMEDLRLVFGEIDFVSERFSFALTDYYSEEMGSPLFRHFISFEPLVYPSSLPEIKRTTNRFEEKYATGEGKRQLNIDPGYLCAAHVILSTTKGYSHRPYLREGIFADLTLLYRNRSFRPLEWTYPDYQQEEVLALFNQIRRKYLEVLR